jgi:hypothetical protein
MKKAIAIVIIGSLLACALLTGCNSSNEPKKDSDSDGITDDMDVFTFDPAASKDSDKDGYPDEWNPGWNETTGETNLTLDAFPNDPTEWEDSDGDGYGDKSDAFPTDPEIHMIQYVEEKNYTLGAGGESNTNFQTTSDDKYAVIYWEANPQTEIVGETISMRFETGAGWLADVYHGLTGQEQVKIDQNNSGDWMLRITHDKYRTGYSGAIEISWRLFILK